MICWCVPIVEIKTVFLNETTYSKIVMEISLKTSLPLIKSQQSSLYKLYAVPVRICSTREDMHYPWVISSVPVSHILSTHEGMQYPWVISSVPVRICSTRENMQYPWVISWVPVRICSTRESYHEYLWVISSVPVRVCSTCEDMQYPCGKFHSFFIHINLLTGTAYPHGYWWYDSWVLHILTGTEDMTHGYWWYDSRVLDILMGNEDMTHGYWGYDSQVLRIWLTGTEDMTHG